MSAAETFSTRADGDTGKEPDAWVLLLIFWFEIPQCIILRREEWEGCEGNVNHKGAS